ncbi:MAG: helix-turn-helix transcriptional regulator [Candidatus Acidiferrales bacterium]
MAKTNTRYSEGQMDGGLEPTRTRRMILAGGIMVIGDKLKELRESKKFSQGDIEKRTGLLRCYISRVENGHTVPSVETLERMARALEIPMYRLFTDDPHVKKPNIPASNGEPHNKKQDAKLRPFVKALSRLTDKDQRLLLHMASKMASRT